MENNNINLSSLIAKPVSVAAEADSTAPVPGQETPGASVVPNETLLGLKEANTAAAVSGNTSLPGSTDKPVTATGTPVTAPTATTGAALSDAISGKFVVDVMDLVFPTIALVILSVAGYTADKKGLQLTAKEKETIAPFMDAYLKSVNLSFTNPLHNLLFIAGAIYAPKIIALIPEMKALPSKAEKQKPVSPVEQANKLVEAEKEREQKRALEIQQLSLMSEQAAVKWLADKKKMGKEKAIAFYRKNVQKK